jgi:hypothetical protein
MSLLSLYAPLPRPFHGSARGSLGRTPRRVKLLLAAALLLASAYEVAGGLQTPAQSIRSELTAAAEEAASIPANRDGKDVRLMLARHFADHDVQVESARFPAEVAVALDGLDRATCLEARSLARRIEGDVVIALDGYGSATDCGARNRMTWRILP